jgi:hypothetical protein
VEVEVGGDGLASTPSSGAAAGKRRFDGRCVRGTGTTQDYEKDLHAGAMPVVLECVGEEVYFRCTSWDALDMLLLVQNFHSTIGILLIDGLRHRVLM